MEVSRGGIKRGERDHRRYLRRTKLCARKRRIKSGGVNNYNNQERTPTGCPRAQFNSRMKRLPPLPLAAFEPPAAEDAPFAAPAPEPAFAAPPVVDAVAVEAAALVAATAPVAAAVELAAAPTVK